MIRLQQFRRLLARYERQISIDLPLSSLARVLIGYYKLPEVT